MSPSPRSSGKSKSGKSNSGKPNSGKPNSGKPRSQSRAADPPDDRNLFEVRAETFRTAAQRETVEAFVVAFILALLFRAFLAEAFVIPTGSMAPTLMGAHKDLTCDQCGTSYQCGASLERRGPEMRDAVVASICPNCRYINPLDLGGEKNDATFNGDRILVSKFAYTLRDPQRWDVIVFKFPGNPKQNNIKRLVGLPDETLTLHHGDVYVRPTGSEQSNDTMLRKPPTTMLAMRHLVHDTNHQAKALLEAKYPSRWQPWTENSEAPPDDSWQIDRDPDGLTASLKSTDPDRFKWLRYFHRWPDDQQWNAAVSGQSLADVDPYSSRLITDFYPYDAYIHVNANRVYEEKPGGRRFAPRGRISRLIDAIRGIFSGPGFVLDPQYKSGEGPEQFNGRETFGSNGLAGDGMHWVGDIMLEADVETSDDAKELMLEIVEAGVKYRCRINLADGTALLSIDDIEPRFFDSADGQANAHPTAQTEIRAGSRHQVRFSNFDDQLVLWVDEDVVSFSSPTTFDARQFRADAEHHPQFLRGIHPLDAAPAAIAVRGGESTIRGLRVDRDKYYIATKNSSSGLFDYDMNALWQATGVNVGLSDMQQVMAQPDHWADFIGWQSRRSVSFELQENQFFPMGDNSPESQDARCWAGTKMRLGMPRSVDDEAYRWADADYVPRDLLVGKALVVFWPHSWNSPVPYLPNFKRMKLIR